MYSAMSGLWAAPKSRSKRGTTWHPGAVSNLHPSPQSSARYGVMDKARYHRHLSCWLGMVRCICCECAGSSGWASHELVGRHVATLSSQIFNGRVPSVRSWIKGLRALWRHHKAEDERSFQDRVGEKGVPLQRVIEEAVVDLRLAPPLGREVFGEQALDPSLALEVSHILAHFARFANAAYALGIYAFTNPGSTCWGFLMGCGYMPGCKMSSVVAFHRMSGIPPEDIRKRNARATPFHPIWWLFLDRSSMAVVVSIRGTFDPNDLITDLVATQKVHRGYILHQGMLESAFNVYQAILEELRHLPELDSLRSGALRLVVVGHSLGGSVAALVSWMLREESDRSDERFNAVAFTYGAPPLGDENLAKRMESFVANVIHNKDVMPCLSISMAKHVRDCVLRETQPAAWRLERLESTLQAFDLPCDPAELREVLRQRHAGHTHSGEDFEDPAEDAHELPTIDMRNAGWQIHLSRRWTRRCACMEWLYQVAMVKSVVKPFLIVAQSPPDDYLRTIRPSTTMWFDHFPFAYQFVCEEYAERLHKLSRNAPAVETDIALRQVMAYLGGKGLRELLDEARIIITSCCEPAREARFEGHRREKDATRGVHFR